MIDRTASWLAWGLGPLGDAGLLFGRDEGECRGFQSHVSADLPMLHTTSLRARRSKTITLASPSRSMTLAKLRQSSICSSRALRPRTALRGASAGAVVT